MREEFVRNNCFFAAPAQPVCSRLDGPSRTAEDKVKIAHRAYKQATEFGIEPHDIFFDPLALPISTGIAEDRRNAAETIASIKKNTSISDFFWSGLPLSLRHVYLQYHFSKKI